MMGQTRPHQETVPCNLCGSHDFVVRYSPLRGNEPSEGVFSASGGVRGTQQIVRCRGCGLMYVNPRLRSDLVLKAYTDTPDDLYLAQAAGRQETFRRSLAQVERTVPDKGKILDVGAAGGFFLHAARESGWEIAGVEPSAWLCRHAKEKLEIDLVCGTVRSAGFADRTFDVVTLWDVLEHVPDPAAELTEIGRVLKPEGLLLVNYPDVGTLLARLAGRHWWFFLSVHLYYFDHRSMSHLLRNTGFEPFQFKRHIQTLSLGHLVKMVGLYQTQVSAWALKLVEALGLENLQIPYYASQINVLARKKA